jgi:hypothetical protein
VAGSHRELCGAHSHDGHQAVNIKVEKFSPGQDGEVPVTVEEIKAEHEVSCMSVSTVGHISGIQYFPFSFSSSSVTEIISSLMNR